MAESLQTKQIEMEMDECAPSPESDASAETNKVCGVMKYIYVVSVFLFGFALIAVKQFSDDFDDWLDESQQQVLEFFLENSMLFIIVVILFISILKGFGVKDVLSLRTISVVILSYKIVSNSQFLTFLLSVLILGVLSSCSKLLEYKVIGRELQIVEGTPTKYIFKYIRKMLLFCFTNEDKIKWLDPKYTFQISDKSRTDSDMDVYSNFHIVITQLFKRKEETQCDIGTAKRVQYRFVAMDTICRILVFVLAVIWCSIIEWVQPITELFLYAHNWRLSFRNVTIIILSEIADIDKMVEVVFIITSLYEDGDVIAGKISGVLFKPVFWALGYLLVMPLSLLWAYQFHQKYLFDASNEILPPLYRTSTPFLSDDADNECTDFAEI